MNALKVSKSRFAVLRIEDDDITEPASPNKTNQKTVKKPSSNQGSNNTNVATTKTKKKKRQNSISNDSTSLPSPSGASKPKTKGNEKSKSKVAAKQQWEEWKEKDSKFVSDAFEQDLQEALLQSKLEFEEQKKHAAFEQKLPSNQHSSNSDEKKKKTKKKDKPAAMSLEEFHNINGNEDNTVGEHIIPVKQVQSPIDGKDFFCEIEKDVERILQREHIKDSVRAIDVQGGDKLLCLQHEKEVQEKDEQVKELTCQVEKVLDELKRVKTRNKKLCNILGQAEMKEKAEILVQVEQLTKIKDELTQQVTELHAALEQEKSKVHALKLELKRYQESKKEARESK